MIETIQQNGLWHLTLAYHNLIDQGGISEEDLGYELINLTYKKRKVVISHIYNEHLVVSLEGEDNEDTKNLMNAFSKVVEYQPFCKYNLKLGIKNISLPTYEWDKIDSEGRFRELKEKKNIDSGEARGLYLCPVRVRPDRAAYQRIFVPTDFLSKRQLLYWLLNNF